MIALFAAVDWVDGGVPHVFLFDSQDEARSYAENLMIIGKQISPPRTDGSYLDAQDPSASYEDFYEAHDAVMGELLGSEYFHFYEAEQPVNEA